MLNLMYETLAATFSSKINNKIIKDKIYLRGVKIVSFIQKLIINKTI